MKLTAKDFRASGLPVEYVEKLMELLKHEDNENFIQGVALASSLGIAPNDILDGLGFSMEMVTIPAGTFEYQEQAEVKVPAFLLGRFQVTEDQWSALMPFWKGADLMKNSGLPVAAVSWLDVKRFIDRLNTILVGDSGWVYDLPHEVEWEYAAKAGQNFEYSGSNDPNEVAWYSENSKNRRHPVGKKKPNAFGLFDMSGNVSEWCCNIYYSKVEKTVKNFKRRKALRDAIPPIIRRVVRGGSYRSLPWQMSITSRKRGVPMNRVSFNGFRLIARKIEAA